MTIIVHASIILATTAIMAYARRSGLINVRLLSLDDCERAEPIRLILTYANVSFRDQRIQWADWSKLKNKTPFGQAPVLYIDSYPIAESWAIYRYLGRRLSLAGRTEKEFTKIDQISEWFRNWHEVSMRFLYLEKNMHDDGTTTYLPTTELVLPILEAELTKSGKFFISSGITWIDFVVAYLISSNDIRHPEAIGKYPRLLNHSKRVLSLPQLQQYLIDNYRTLSR